MFKLTIENAAGVKTTANFRTMEEAVKFAQSANKVESNDSFQDIDFKTVTTKQLTDRHNNYIKSIFDNAVDVTKHSVVKTPKSVTSLANCWGAFEGMNTTQFCSLLKHLADRGIIKTGKRGLDGVIFGKICTHSRRVNTEAFFKTHSRCSVAN